MTRGDAGPVWHLGSCRTERRHPLPTRSAAAQVGLCWAAATVAFEFGFGHYVNPRQLLVTGAGPSLAFIGMVE